MLGAGNALGQTVLRGGGARANPAAIVAALLGADRLAHWDATDLPSQTLSGSAVTGWKELVGGGIAAPGAAPSRPAYAAAGFAGKGPAVSFDGVANYLRIDQAWLPGAAAGEIWALLRQDIAGDTAGAAGIFTTGTATGGATSRQLLRNPVSSVNRGLVISGNGSTSDSALLMTVDFSGYCIARCRWTGTQVSLDINDSTPVTAASVPATGIARTVIGANSAFSAAFATMALSAILVTHPLSTDKAAALRAHLRTRF